MIKNIIIWLLILVIIWLSIFIFTNFKRKNILEQLYIEFYNSIKN